MHFFSHKHVALGNMAFGVISGFPGPRGEVLQALPQAASSSLDCMVCGKLSLQALRTLL